MLRRNDSGVRSTSKGIVKGHEIYIIRTAEMPVALIEVGFMTNQDELNRLNDEAYQKEAAQAIYNAIYRAFQEDIKMNKIIFATGNKDKMKEIRMILSDLDVEILSMKRSRNQRGY